MALIDDYRRGMEMLFTSAPEFSKLAHALGRPIGSSRAKTLQVEWDKSSKTVRFVVNPEFIAGLTDEELGATIAHETYHVFFDHLGELVRDGKKYPNKWALTMAHECIINDGLFDKVGLRLPDGCVKGEELFDNNFDGWSTEDAYAYIDEKFPKPPQDKPESGKDGEDSDSGSGQMCEDGCAGGSLNDLTEDELEDLKDYLKDQINGSMSEDDRNAIMEVDQALADIIEDALDDIQINGKSFGKIKSNGGFQLIDMGTMTLQWFKLLAYINPKIKQVGANQMRANWTRPPRQLMEYYPNIILPNYEYEVGDKDQGDNLPVVILALDLSPSIPCEIVADLVNLADSVPEDCMKSVPVTWSSDVMLYDKKMKKVVESMGTDIDALYNFVKKYEKDEQLDEPPYVVVISDGEYSFSTADQNVKDRWFFLGIDEDSVNMMKKRDYDGQSYADSDKVFALKDFV